MVVLKIQICQYSYEQKTFPQSYYLNFFGPNEIILHLVYHCTNLYVYTKKHQIL